MDDDARGERLEAYLNDELGGGRRTYFSHIGEGTLVNEAAMPGVMFNITIRDGEASVALLGMNERGSGLIELADIGDFRWNDAKGIAAALRRFEPEVFDQPVPRYNPRRNRR
jgi:hypothetical protein